MRKYIVLLTAMMVAVGAVMAFSAFGAGAPAPKVDVCHINGNGVYNLINVSGNAVPAHLAHGDAFPGDIVGGKVLGPDCSLIPFSLSLLGNGATSLDITVGDHVVYTGHYAYGSTPVASAPVTLSVWSGFGCSGGALYTGIAAGLTNASGDYSFDGGPSPFGDYSLMAFTANATSNCINVSVQTVSATLYNVTANKTAFDCVTGVTDKTVPTASSVSWKNLTNGDIRVTITLSGAAVSSTFDVWVEQNPGTCPFGTNSPSNGGAITTDTSGNGTTTFEFTPQAGAANYWLSLWTPSGSLTGTQVLRSTAVAFS